jgi:hypothetical protein
MPTCKTISCGHSSVIFLDSLSPFPYTLPITKRNLIKNTKLIMRVGLIVTVFYFHDGQTADNVQALIKVLEALDIDLRRDLCITPPFARLLRQAQISILEILNAFLRLKVSPSLYLDKIGCSSKVSRMLCLFAIFISRQQRLPRQGVPDEQPSQV